MAETVLTNAKVWLDKLALAAEANAVALEYGAETGDATTLQDGTRVAVGGLTTLAVSIQGLYDPSGSDDALFAAMGVSDSVLSVVPPTAQEGAVAFLARILESSYNPSSGSIGDLAVYSVEGAASSRPGLVRGLCLADRSLSGPVALPGFQVGAVGATQRLYAGLHVVSLTGGTFDWALESDSASGFATPTQQTTGTASAVGSTWIEVPGAVTDDWWRLNVTAMTASAAIIAMVAGIR